MLTRMIAAYHWGVIMRSYLVLVNRIMLFSSQSHSSEGKRNGKIERQDMTVPRVLA